MLFLQISKEKGVITSLKYNFVFLYYRKLQKSLGSVGSNRPLNLNGVVTRRNKQTNKQIKMKRSAKHPIKTHLSRISRKIRSAGPGHDESTADLSHSTPHSVLTILVVFNSLSIFLSFFLPLTNWHRSGCFCHYYIYLYNINNNIFVFLILSQILRGLFRSLPQSLASTALSLSLCTVSVQQQQRVLLA